MIFNTIYIMFLVLFASVYYVSYLSGGVNTDMQSNGSGPISYIDINIVSIKFRYDSNSGVSVLNLPFMLAILLSIINIVWMSVLLRKQR
ncbi:hypothetical protein SU48_10090 [Deinococcus puniceus]|uniref:Uncharacterized protein n=1 Tax=Deinococcus puniceus TaxID=1182568 RepID=A0A172TAK4_9DEIO|nr:hypothetical protein SU48_10090 [Deinococcus puniceus]